MKKVMPYLCNLYDRWSNKRLIRLLALLLALAAAPFHVSTVMLSLIGVIGFTRLSAASSRSTGYTYTKVAAYSLWRRAADYWASGVIAQTPRRSIPDAPCKEFDAIFRAAYYSPHLLLSAVLRQRN
jgi:hypothetical protein